MKPVGALICLLMVFLWVLPGASAHNPFTSRPENQHPPSAPIVKSEFFVKIVFWQHQLREKMSGLMREARATGSIAPLLLLAAVAYAYGVVHAAGPGHGKAVALSYIMSCRPSLATGLGFGNILALTHGASGIALVLAVKFVLEAGINQSLETMTYVTQIVGFSLITLMGLAIVAKGGLNWFRPRQVREDANHTRGHYAAAVAVGLVPCPGVVMVMLFAISLQLTWLGILLGLCIAAGMASTITLIILAAMSGKTAVLRLTGGNQARARIFEIGIEILAGLGVALLGATFLLANL